jgi:hypothetical protein
MINQFFVRILFFFVLCFCFSCKKENIESFSIDNREYIIKTDSINTQVINNDTLKFYYLKDKLRSVTINDFVTPEYDTVTEDSFFFKTTYCINKNNEFDAAVIDLYGTYVIGCFKQNTEYDLIEKKWQKQGMVEHFFYDYVLLNLDIALTRINNYNYPKSVTTIPNESLITIFVDQDKKITFYDVKKLEKVESQSHKSFSFRYLRDIKVVEKGNEKLVLAKIIEEENGNEFYINLKDITEDIQIAD